MQGICIGWNNGMLIFLSLSVRFVGWDFGWLCKSSGNFALCSYPQSALHGLLYLT